MLQFIILFVVLILSINFSLIFKKQTAETIPFSMLFIVLVLYFFGLFNKLNYGVYFLIILVLIGIIYILIKITNKNIDYNFFINYPTLFFILFFLLMLFSSNNKLLFEWDAFTHWGTTVKNMYILNDFGSSNLASTQIKHYPPGISLFQYFYIFLCGAFKDEYLINAITCFSFSFLMILFSVVKSKKITFNLLMFILILIIPIMYFNSYYYSIYVDALIGIIFGYLLIMYFNCKFNVFAIINICFTLFVLILIKDIGLIMAILFFIIVISDTSLFKQSFSIFLLNGKNSKKHAFWSLISMFFSIMIAKFSWGISLKIRDIGTEVSTSSNFLKIIKLFSLKPPEYYSTVITNYIKYLYEGVDIGFKIKISFFSVLMIITIIYTYIHYKCQKKQEKNRLFFVYAYLLLIVFSYLLFLMISYLCFFSEYEALKLASIYRYTSTILLSISLVTIYYVLIYIKDNSHKFLCIIIFILLFFVSPNSILNLTIFAKNHTKNSQVLREQYDDIKKVNKIINWKKEKLYYISINDDGFSYYLSKYLTVPIQFNNDKPKLTWSIGKKRNSSEIWINEEIDEEKWAYVLYKEYDYVYINNIDEIFIQQYGNLFYDKGDVKNKTLFKVIKDSKDIKLYKVKLK